MTKKNYKTLIYYECSTCGQDWDDLLDKRQCQDCPDCGRKNVKPIATFENVLEWTDHYTTIPNHIHPEEEDHFETYGEDFEHIKTYDQNYVWTVVSNDFGRLSIGKGLHHVNRMYYVISKESHENDNENYYW